MLFFNAKKYQTGLKVGKIDGWVDGKKQVLIEKIGPHMSCNLHKIGAIIYSELPVAPLSAKKYGPGWVEWWMDGWMDGWEDGRMGGWVDGWWNWVKDCLQQSKTL